MNGEGPEMLGAKSGRKLGNCSNESEKDISLLGKGMGKRKNSGGGIGLGKRLQSRII